MKRNKITITIISLVLILGIYYINHKSVTNNTNVNKTTASSTVSIKSGPSNLYPDPTLTPGDVLTTDATKVCASGYSKSIRNVSSQIKKDVYKEYNVSYPQPTGSIEVDHFISLELGGSNDIKNLWPEFATPTPGFHEKDKVENYLHEQVCKGSISLEEAQKEISTDWYKVYLNIN